jgi:hypothetical protein
VRNAAEHEPTGTLRDSAMEFRDLFEIPATKIK